MATPHWPVEGGNSQAHDEGLPIAGHHAQDVVQKEGQSQLVQVRVQPGRGRGGRLKVTCRSSRPQNVTDEISKNLIGNLISCSFKFIFNNKLLQKNWQLTEFLDKRTQIAKFGISRIIGNVISQHVFSERQFAKIVMTAN